jgi:hypothetical protein
MAQEEVVSPDGALRLVVSRDDSDVTIGFAGFPWHTHGDLLAGCSWAEATAPPASRYRAVSVPREPLRRSTNSHVPATAGTN